MSIGLVSCNAQNVSEPISENQTSTAISTPSPFPSETPISTSTVFLTATPESTETLTPPPTLSQPTSEAEIKLLMQNDIECNFPCFLGVIPEQTTVGELVKGFTRYGLHLHPHDPLDSAYTIFSFGPSEIPPYSHFYIQDGRVQTIKIEIDQTNEFEWALYYPAALLKRLGTPSSVTFALSTIPDPSLIPSKAWYYMTFFYDDSDLVVQYFMAEVKLGDLITLCPNKDTFQGAQIWLGVPLKDAPSPTEDGHLEEATTFTIENIRDFLLQGPDACFDLKSSAVPMY
jgi:hypothetical protein